MTELKPCPFCGGEASVKVLEYDDDCKVWGVFCESDLESEYSHGHFVDNYATEAEAIAAWNSRAELGSEPPYDELVRCLKNDWNIRVSWDGLRKFWSIELTEEGVRLRDAESNSRAERICHETMIDKYFRGCDSCGWMWEVFYSFGKRERPNYCPNCGAKVVGA